MSDLGPTDFVTLRKRMAQRWGPVRLGNVVQRARSIFKFALDSARAQKLRIVAVCPFARAYMRRHRIKDVSE